MSLFHHNKSYRVAGLQTHQKENFHLLAISTKGNKKKKSKANNPHKKETTKRVTILNKHYLQRESSLTLHPAKNSLMDLSASTPVSVLFFLMRIMKNHSAHFISCICIKNSLQFFCSCVNDFKEVLLDK